MIKIVNGKAIIECNYYTRPGVKKAFEKTVRYKRSKEAKEKIDQYSGEIKVDAGFEGLGLRLSASVGKSWADAHSFSISTEKEEFSSEESSVEYYDNVTLLIRSMNFRFFIDGVSIEQNKETVVQNVKDDYSLEQLTAEAKKFMKMMYGADKSSNVKFVNSIKFVKNVYVRWKTYYKGEPLPKDAVYAGNIIKYGSVYVARWNATPGLVNTNSDKVENFGVRDSVTRSDGEILLTNGHYKWVEIKKGKKLPENAVCSGYGFWYNNKDSTIGKKVWVGKTIAGMPGEIRCDNSGAFDILYTFKGEAFKAGGHFSGYALTIS